MVSRSYLTGPVFGLRREIDRLFEDTFGREGSRTGWAPAVDVREDDRSIVLEVELPGIKPEDVELTAENGVLTIRGEKQSVSQEGSEGRYHLVERTYGSFARSFQLPQGVDDTRIEAEFDNGLLMVRVPKAALPGARRIEIRNSGSQPAIQGPGMGGARSGGASETGRGSAQGTPQAGSGTVGQGGATSRATTGGQREASGGVQRETAGAQRDTARAGGGASGPGSTPRASGRGAGSASSSRTNTRGGR